MGFGGLGVWVWEVDFGVRGMGVGGLGCGDYGLGLGEGGCFNEVGGLELEVFG